MSSQDISRVVSEYVKGMEEVTNVEVATHLLFVALSELDVAPKALFEAPVAGTVLWTGSLGEARNALKRPTIIEDLLNGEQEELFPEQFSAFLCVGKNAQGVWRFKRRRSCSQEEYLAGLNFLEEKAEQLQKKIDRYRNDYNVALPFWHKELSFAQAYRKAMEHRGE